MKKLKNIKINFKYSCQNADQVRRLQPIFSLKVYPEILEVYAIQNLNMLILAPIRSDGKAKITYRLL